MKSKFQQAVEAQSTLLSGGQRFKDGMRFEIYTAGDGAVTLEKFQAISKGNGKGRRFLSWLTQAADEDGVTLKLTANAADAGRQADLVRLYKEFKFKGLVSDEILCERGGQMIREPAYDGLS